MSLELNNTNHQILSVILEVILSEYFTRWGLIGWCKITGFWFHFLREKDVNNQEN